MCEWESVIVPQSVSCDGLATCPWWISQPLDHYLFLSLYPHLSKLDSLPNLHLSTYCYLHHCSTSLFQALSTSLSLLFLSSSIICFSWFPDSRAIWRWLSEASCWKNSTHKTRFEPLPLLDLMPFSLSTQTRDWILVLLFHPFVPAPQLK